MNPSLLEPISQQVDKPIIKSRTKEYNAWINAKSRCYNPKNKRYKTYGARGITVCERWIYSFDTFIKDMGKCPVGYSIDRKNNNGNYEPSNCRWIPRSHQQKNQTRSHFITANGKTQTLADWSREVGIHHTLIVGRIRRLGWSEEKAVTTPRKWKKSNPVASAFLRRNQG